MKAVNFRLAEQLTAFQNKPSHAYFRLILEIGIGVRRRFFLSMNSCLWLVLPCCFRIYGRVLASFVWQVINWLSSFSGAFAKLRKATVSFVMSVCSSVRMEQLGDQWTEFHEISDFSIFRKRIEKIQVSLKSDKNNGHFIWRPIFIFDHISLISS